MVLRVIIIAYSRTVDALINVIFKFFVLFIMYITMWLYVQAYTSVRSASPELKDNRDLAVLMNTVAFHTLLVDSQEEILNETSELSIFWYDGLYITSTRCYWNSSFESRVEYLFLSKTRFNSIYAYFRWLKSFRFTLIAVSPSVKLWCFEL